MYGGIETMSRHSLESWDSKDELRIFPHSHTYSHIPTKRYHIMKLISEHMGAYSVNYTVPKGMVIEVVISTIEN